MEEADILKLIYKNEWMMGVLKAAQELELPDWMIGAGFVRNKVWDYLHGFRNAKVPTNDIDLIYFDPHDPKETTEKKYDDTLKKQININWSCKNQARMHIINGDRPYKNSLDALSHWVETATAIAVKLEQDDSLTLFAPHGLDDLFNLILRPTPAFTNKDKIHIFRKRIAQKEWLKKYPKLKVVEHSNTNK